MGIILRMKHDAVLLHRFTIAPRTQNPDLACLSPKQIQVAHKEGPIQFLSVNYFSFWIYRYAGVLGGCGGGDFCRMSRDGAGGVLLYARASPAALL